MKTSGLLLAALLPAATAAPHNSRATPPYPSYSTDTRPWTFLRDKLMGLIWNKHDGTFIATTSGVLRSNREDTLVPSSKPVAQYGNDVVLRFNLTRSEEARALADASDSLLLDVWSATDSRVDLRVAQDMVTPLLSLLPSSLQSAYTPIMTGNDLARAVAETYPSSRNASRDDDLYRSRERGTSTSNIYSTSDMDSPSGKDLFFSQYRPLAVLVPWMRLMESLFSTHVKLIDIGRTYENRIIHGLRVGVRPATTPPSEPSKPRSTIIVTGGLHAREWISVSTAAYVAFSMITGYGRDSDITKLLEDFDWVFVPTLNPDGYSYSWDADRLWRKNRQPTKVRFCKGLDLDRSFGYKWNGETTKDNPCAETFAGTSAFEGIEAKALADWARNETEQAGTRFVGLLDLHSYSQQILFPYSYTCGQTPPTLEDLEELGQGLAKAIRGGPHGKGYSVAPACEGNVAISTDASSGDATAAVGGRGRRTMRSAMEQGGGSLLDYFYKELGVRHAYQIKLRDTGGYGFLLPKEYIIPTGEEIFRAVQVFGKATAAALALAASENAADGLAGAGNIQQQQQQHVFTPESQSPLL